MLFDEAIQHYGSGAPDNKRPGFSRDLLLQVCEAEAKARKTDAPGSRESLNQMVVDFTKALAAFLRAEPLPPPITAVAGPTAPARGAVGRRGRLFLHVGFLEAPRTARRLPAPVALTGRDAERARLRALLMADPLPPYIALLGVPGIGRTALAVAVAHELLDEETFEEAVLYRFDPADEPASVRDVLVSLTGFARNGAPQPAEATLCEIYLTTLAKHRTIIILDDMPDGWPLERLEPPRGSVVLLTALHAVRLPGAAEFPLAPLARSAAIRFLLDLEPRLRETFPTYEEDYHRWRIFGKVTPRPHPTAASKLADVCAYTPAELRTAATALRERPDMGVHAFLVWYEQRLTARDGAASSATAARDAAFWPAYVPLGDNEQRAFRALSVFADAFSAAAAKCVIDDPDGAAFIELRRVGLVQTGPEDGLYVLAPPLRLFGQRRFAADADRAMVLHRFASYYVVAGEQEIMRGGFRLDRVGRRIVANFEAAQRAAVECQDAELIAHFGYVAAYAHPPTAEVWLTAAAEAVRTLANPELLLHIAIGQIKYYRVFDLERALRAAEEALVAVPVAEDDDAAVSDLPEYIERRRDRIAHKGMRIARALGRARTVTALGLERLKQPNVVKSVEHDTFPVLMAEAYLSLGDLSAALEWARSAVVDASVIQNPIYRANALIVWGRALLAARRRGDAREMFDAALALYPDAFRAREGDAHTDELAREDWTDSEWSRLRDAYADHAKLHPALVAYTLRTLFVRDIRKLARRCDIIAEHLNTVRLHMPALYVDYGRLLLYVARRGNHDDYAASAVGWFTFAVGLYAERGVDDLLRSEGIDMTAVPADDSEYLLAIATTPFLHMHDLRAVGNAYCYRAEAFLLLDDPRNARADFELAQRVLTPIESPLLPRIAQRLRALEARSVDL
ncbi:MAG TPA: hypothetical protein VJZ76_03430 [Thermoanaerobaculia bacterium]|nr:hypothetical protein [Thermoanaerobaculia bacterium]